MFEIDTEVSMHLIIFSGVGDLENIRIDGSLPKTYDYADYGHQYEELPNRRSIAKFPPDGAGDARSDLYQSSGGATYPNSEADDTANIVHNHTEKRYEKRLRRYLKSYQ